MTLENETLFCYEKLLPKWTAIIVLIAGAIVAFFLPLTSWVFYFWIGICGLFVFKTLTQKPATSPTLIINEQGIRLSDKSFYSYKEIEKVMAFSAKKLRFRSINFKLYLRKGKAVEFSVDNLDVKPQIILDTINQRIK